MPGENQLASCVETQLDHDYVYVTSQEYRDADQRKHIAEIYRCLKCNGGHIHFLPLEDSDE